jgi:hypothetical protein
MLITNIIKNQSSQKGVSLLFIVLIMGVILSIGLGLGGIFVQQSKMMRDIGKSMISFYAADSGIEIMLYDIYTKASSSLSNISTITSKGSSIDVSVRCGNSLGEKCPTNFLAFPICGFPNFCIKSIGGYEKAQRVIEINY